VVTLVGVGYRPDRVGVSTLKHIRVESALVIVDVRLVTVVKDIEPNMYVAGFKQCHFRHNPGHMPDTAFIQIYLAVDNGCQGLLGDRFDDFDVSHADV
jgi:hypothetical protein